MRKRTRSAFSLVELLVVVAIIAILALGGVLGVRGLLVRGRLAEAVTAVERQVRQARADVKRDDIALTLVFDSDAVLGSGDRLVSFPTTVTLEDDATRISLAPPFGTWTDAADGDLVLTFANGDLEREVVVTGVLAKVVRP